MRLYRPYIPIGVRVEVALRQLRERGVEAQRQEGSARAHLAALLLALFGDAAGRAELHHRPALENRPRRAVRGKTVYEPDANDPNHLVYLLDDEHDVETRVRGQHGQLSDHAIARKRKRKERKEGRPRRRWPKRRGQWPPKGSRKLRWWA